MKKRIYELSDIEKILTFIPPVFIVLLAGFITTVGYFILEYRQKNEINLIEQKIELQRNYKFQNELKNYLQIIDKQIQYNLNEQELRLKEAVHTIRGITKGIQKEKEFTLKDLQIYLEEYKNTQDIQFAIFDSHYSISYGKEQLQEIQKLIFSNSFDKELLKITLMYIASQGEKSSFRWRDDIQKTIQLSYFEKNSTGLYIGAFSSISSIRKIAQNTIIETISKVKSKDYYLWFYDKDTKRGYNLEEEHKWQISKIPSSPISYEYDKYFFKIALVPKTHKLDDTEKRNVLREYQDKKVLLFAVIFFTTFIFIFATSLFSSFIKRIFSAHDRRLEHKNRMLNIWKERFELAIIASNDGLWDTDFETKKTFFSKKWLGMLGYKQGDVTSYEEWFALIHKEDRTLVHNTLSEHINEQKEHIICQYRLKTKENRYKWVLARGKVFLNKDKTPKRLLMMSMDIDEEKRLEKDLKDTELLVSDGEIVVLRVQNSECLEVLFVSKSIKMYGYEYKDFFTKQLTFLDIIHPEDKDSFIASLHAYINQGFSDFSKSYRIITKSSEVKWVFNRMIFIKDDFGNITNLYGYLSDITALKQSEIELENRVKLEVSKNQEKQKILIQQNKLAAMGEMIGSIAHQWRQPLNNISLILHFIKDNYKNIDEKELQRYTTNAKEQLEYMSQTIDDFRDFYKPSKQKEYFSIQEAIKTSLSILKNQLEKNSIEVLLEADDYQVYGFANEFKQALLNIFSNAIEAIKETNPKHGTITIEAKKESISISNNGGVASEEVLERMFEPYFTTKFENKGTGIGLYMTKTIIENMHGSIRAYNIDDGVRFEILLKG